MNDEVKKIVKALNRCSCNREDDCTYICPYAASDQYCRDQMESDAADLIKRIVAELEQLRSERDAAVNDMRELGACCYSCKHYTENKPCQECDLQYSGWEWRGVCTENSGGDKDGTD